VKNGGTILGYDKCYKTDTDPVQPVGCRGTNLQSDDYNYNSASATARTTGNSFAVEGYPLGNVSDCDIKAPCNTTCSLTEKNTALVGSPAGTPTTSAICHSAVVGATPNVVPTMGLNGALTYNASTCLKTCNST